MAFVDEDFPEHDSEEDIFDDDVDPLGGTLGEGTDDFGIARVVTNPGLNMESLAAATKIAFIDEQVTTVLATLESVRQLVGPKEELIDSLCRDVESTINLITLEFRQDPAGAAVRAILGMPSDERDTAITKFIEAADWLKSQQEAQS